MKINNALKHDLRTNRGFKKLFTITRISLFLFFAFSLQLVATNVALTADITEITQQKHRVTGVVVDDVGEPIIGANVIGKGTTNGTITDFDGKFSLSVESDAVLHISYIGYIA